VTQPVSDSAASLPALMADLGRRARAAASALVAAPAEARTRALAAMAERLRAAEAPILDANAQDIAAATAAGLSPALIDRLTLGPKGVAAMAGAIEAIAAQPDPVGAEIARWTRPNGLDIARVRTPIGVLAVIYESRPNVTAEAAALCVRSANAVILRPGSDALRTSRAIQAALAEGLKAAGLPGDTVQIVPTGDREAVGLILRGLDGAVDLVIPRGGRGLVERVQAEARVPVLGHLEGICHTFVHRAADPKKARDIVVNAKMRRVSVCGATETLLVDAAAAERLLPPIAEALDAAGCELRGDAAARRIWPDIVEAMEEDWRTEYLAPILAVRIVEDVEGAAEHIRAYGSGHTDAIVTEDQEAAERFLGAVDSAIVLWNASTQFADGGEFGFGGEIGIATGKLHARGPVGAEQLTSYKYVVRGSGQVRA
jgi:glutamate-5-semialdehyde dehydrogenase